MIKEKHIVTELKSKTRLSDYLIGIFELCPTKSSIKKAIKKNNILVNDTPMTTGYFVQQGDMISFQTNYTYHKQLEFDIPVVFEDDYLAVINKPAGISVSGNQFYTIENALPNNLMQSSQSDAIRPQPTHRLDNQTSGLLIIAKTKMTRILIGKMFEDKTIQKTYHAIVIGDISEDGIINTPIEGKDAKTIFEKINSSPSLKNEYLSLVKLYPKTGRTHQLRIHMSSIGFPILGDKLYGKEGMILKNKGLFLCSTGLQFQHPILNVQKHISIPLPNKFTKRLENEARRFVDFNK